MNVLFVFLFLLEAKFSNSVGVAAFTSFISVPLGKTSFRIKDFPELANPTITRPFISDSSLGTDCSNCASRT